MAKKSKRSAARQAAGLEAHDRLSSASLADRAGPARPTVLWPVGGVFALALVVRLVHVWQIRRAPFFSVLMGDARGYDEWARRIAAGDWIGKDVFYQAPLYPYFLGAIYTVAGHSLVAVRLMQAVIGSSACALLALAGRRFFSPRVGLIAGLALALYAPAIFFDGLIQKSVLDVFLVCTALWLLSGLVERAHQTFGWLWLGVALGALALTRENALVLIVVVAVWAVYRLRGGPMLAPLASFVLGLAVLLLPVAVRNYAVGGGFYLTTSQFGPNFYIGNNPRADGTYVPLKEGRGTPEFERQDATDLAERASGRALTPAEVSSYWTSETLHYITAQPGAWMKLMARKFALLWNRTEAADTESQETYEEWSTPLQALGWIGQFGVVVPFALLGTVAAWPDRKRLWVLYALTAAYAASVLMFYVFARYRFPLVPLLLLFAAEGASALPRLFRAARPPARTAALVAATVVVAVFANWPVLSASSMAAITENNLGTALQDDKQLDAAIAHYQRALALDAAYEPALNNLGTALREKGDAKAAIAVYQRAIEAAPGSANAHFNLGNALVDANEIDQAIRQFTIAAERDAGSVDIQNNLGIALARAGRNADAAAAFGRAVNADPNSGKAHENLAETLLALGRAPEAVEHFKRAIALDPRDASLHYDLGQALLETKALVDAAGEFQKAIALDGGADAYNGLGAALSYEGRTAEAVAAFQQALKLDPKNESAQQNLTAVLRAQTKKR